MTRNNFNSLLLWALLVSNRLLVRGTSPVSTSTTLLNGHPQNNVFKQGHMKNIVSRMRGQRFHSIGKTSSFSFNTLRHTNGREKGRKNLCRYVGGRSHIQNLSSPKIQSYFTSPDPTAFIPISNSSGRRPNVVSTYGQRQRLAYQSNPYLPIMIHTSSFGTKGVLSTKPKARNHAATALYSTSSSSVKAVTKSKKSKEINSSSTLSKIREAATNKKYYKLVIVESPSKAKTISNLLNTYASNYNLPYKFLVDSCMGHVRDLPTSAKLIPSSLTEEQRALFTEKVLGVNVRDSSYQPLYIVLPNKVEVVDRLKGLAESEDCIEVVLATDEDREGEAIAWHLSEILKSASNEKVVDMTRVTFNEITKKSIETAFFGDGRAGAATESTDVLQERRGVDMDLVQAQETRRILDRLAGYTMSPLLWKKIAPGLSAGRVQSVGMSLIVNRERERMRFKESEYWDLKVNLRCGTDTGLQGELENVSGTDSGNADTFTAILFELNGTRLATGKDFDGETGLLKDDLMQKAVNGAESIPAVHHLSKECANDLLSALAGGEITPWLRDPNLSKWTIQSVQSRPRSNSPPAPFITSTLQQESNKRLGLSVSDTMRCAQILYEAGYISYMRTDSPHLSDDAVKVGQNLIVEKFGKEYLSETNFNDNKRRKKRGGKSNVNAQEAHEAIRPSIQDDEETPAFVEPSSIVNHHKRKSGGGSLPDTAVRLYSLIYNRTAASFMSNQLLNQTSVVVRAVSDDGTTTALFRTSGSIILFPGYTKLWNRGDSSTDDENDLVHKLPSNMAEGQELYCNEATALEHRTKPPPRYTEASFVKELELLGVGRPSTYASVVQTLRSRAYIGTPAKIDENVRSSKLAKKIKSGAAISAIRAAGGEEFMGSGRGPLVPSLSAFVVCSLLEKYCPSYVDCTFTAKMEERLDKIADGDDNNEDNRISYLDEYYGGENGLAAQVMKIDQSVSGDEARRANLPSLNRDLKEGGEQDDIGLFIGPWGPYIQRINDPTGSKPEKPVTAALPMGLASDLSKLTSDLLKTILSSRERDGILLGVHPDDGRPIRWKMGRYGAYLQWGDPGEEKTTNHSLPKHIGGLGGRNIDLQTTDLDGDVNIQSLLGITFEEALGYISLPRTICTINDMPITASIGPYGPYLKFNNTFLSLNENDGDVLTVGPDIATVLVTDGIIKKKSKMARGVLAELGEKEGNMIRVKDGRFGMYLNWQKVNAKLPAEFYDNPSELPLEVAWTLIQEKAGSSTGRKTKNGSKKGGKSADGPTLPPSPKRPKSAYLFFCAEKRPEVSKKVKSLGDISKELARLWADTAEGNDRAPYEKLASEEKADYEKKREEWKDECDRLIADYKVQAKNGSKPLKKSSRKETKAKNASKNLESPKRPLSAYLYFCADKRPEVAKESDSLGEVTKELARQWREIGKNGGEEVEKYEKLAKADKMRYEQEMERFNISRTNSKSITSSKNEKSQKRAPSAYMLFCSENRKNIRDEHGEKKSFGETTKELAKMWTECDAETRKFFEAKAAEAKAKISQ